MDFERIFDGIPVSRNAILQSRTDRAIRQQEALKLNCESLISFTLNIPGPVKQFSLAQASFDEGLVGLRGCFSGHIVHEHITISSTGSEAILCLDLSPESAKQQVVALEEYHPLGRLFDMDVLRRDGSVISRTALSLPPRRCLLCEENAKICVRSQIHSMDALRLRTIQLMHDYFRDQRADACASCASRALLYEVSATPKPGLVDRTNSGSHSDMDFFTFLDSSIALLPHFREMFRIGWDQFNVPAQALFQQLRFSGLQAEHSMFHATGGVNTHKGLIFSLGILCAALGQTASQQAFPLPVRDVLTHCRRLGCCSLKDFQTDPPHLTHGLTCFQQHHITGARGEAAEGFTKAIEIGLPSLRYWRGQGLSLNDAACATLLALIAHTDDTNMIHRGGMALALERKHQAEELLESLNKDSLLPLLTNLDQQYIQENLSPGGCADLLAISLMLFFLEEDGLIVP